MVKERNRRQRARVCFYVERLRGSYPEPGQIVSMGERDFLVRLSGKPPAARELIRLRVELPGADILVHAVVARLVSDGEGTLAACRPFVLTGFEKELWDEAVRGASQHYEQAA